MFDVIKISCDDAIRSRTCLDAKAWDIVGLDRCRLRHSMRMDATDHIALPQEIIALLTGLHSA